MASVAWLRSRTSRSARTRSRSTAGISSAPTCGAGSTSCWQSVVRVAEITPRVPRVQSMCVRHRQSVARALCRDRIRRASLHMTCVQHTPQQTVQRAPSVAVLPCDGQRLPLHARCAGVLRTCVLAHISPARCDVWGDAPLLGVAATRSCSDRSTVATPRDPSNPYLQCPWCPPVPE